MPKRERTNAGEFVKRSLADQMDGLTMFDATTNTPVGSQPRRGSEQTADRLQVSRARVSKEHMALERLAQGPITVDGYVQELRELTGAVIERSSWAPRFTNNMNAGWCEYDDTVAQETSMGGTASPYRITEQGRTELARRAALRQEKEAEQYVNRFGRKK